MNINYLTNALRAAIKKFIRHKTAAFVMFVVVAYGFIAWRASNLADVQVDQNAVTKQTTALQPHVDQATIQKIQELQDNSVNVRALFNQSRQNPFKE